MSHLGEFNCKILIPQVPLCSPGLPSLMDYGWGCQPFLTPKSQKEMILTTFENNSGGLASISGAGDDDHWKFEELLKVFTKFDDNGDGFICKSDMAKLMIKLGTKVSERDLDLTLAAVDENGDGLVSFDEFCSVFLELKKDGEFKEAEDDLREAFRIFDRNNDGFISAEELQMVLCNLGFLEGRKFKDCRNMIRMVDSNGDGQVDFVEFKLMMCDGFFKPASRSPH